MLERLGVLIESRIVRTGLVALIVLSLVPFEAVEDTLRWVFVVAFGLELAIRVPLLIRARRERVRRAELLFILFDVLALISFLPDAWLPDPLEALRVLRLARLVVLLRFAREQAADLWSILTRREQLQQFALVSFAVAALAFISAVLLTELGIPHDYDASPDSGEGFMDQIWWSFRQIESADNLVVNLHVHPVVGVLSLVLTVLGVFIISFIIGIGTKVVEQVVRAERRRAVGYSGHTCVIGPIEESEILVREFVRIHAKNRRDPRDQLAKIGRWLVRGGIAPRPWRLPRMALLGPSEEPPAVLLERDMRWVIYRRGEGGDADDLARIGAARAKRVILLGDRSAGIDADAITVATLSALREMNPDAHVYLELLSTRNFSTLAAISESSRTFPLDVTWFLGLFMLHHLTIPGVERLYRFLLTTDGSELYSHIYQSASELEAITAQGDDEGMIDPAHLSRLAAEHGVVLVGVFLGVDPPEEGPHDLIVMEGLVPWVNPHDDPQHPRVVELGASAGRVPADKIRGVIAVGESYRPVRSFARSFSQGTAAPEAPHVPPVMIGVAKPPPRRILVIGYSDAIASLATRLAELTERAEIIVVTDGDATRTHALRGALARAGVELEAEGSLWVAPLKRGGRLEVRADRHGDAMEAGLEVLHEAPVEAVVFVAEPDARDHDARTALRLMRLAEDLLAHELPAPHVLAELTNIAKGERARFHVAAAFRRAGIEPPRVTLVSTEQIRNYFMVHSAFVPGIMDVYAQLLGAIGQDLVRLPLEAEGAVTLEQCAVALSDRRMIPLGFERESGEVILNPRHDVEVDDVVGVFAIGEVDTEWTEG